MWIVPPTVVSMQIRPRLSVSAPRCLGPRKRRVAVHDDGHNFGGACLRRKRVCLARARPIRDRESTASKWLGLDNQVNADFPCQWRWTYVPVGANVILHVPRAEYACVDRHLQIRPTTSCGGLAGGVNHDVEGRPRWLHGH